MIQLQVLNKILRDKDASIITLNNLTSDYFSEYPEEFWFIKEHLDEYGCLPDMETFVSKFEDFELIEVNEPTSYLLEELNNDRVRRELTENYNRLRPLLMSGEKEDTEKALTILKEAAEKSASLVSLNCVNILEDTSRYDSYLDRLENYDKYFIKTGFDELDALIGGWDVKEELATIVARTGMGKSWLLLKCASAAAKQGKTVGIYSGEMSENKVGYRLDTLMGNFSNGALIHGGASVKNEYRKYLDNLQENVPGKIFVLTPQMINGPAGVSALRAFVEKYNLDILFVDQHSLLDDDRKGKTPVEKASNISKDLKLLQVIKQIPIISVSQQNRSTVEGKAFDTTQVAQSDRIVQDSTIVIFIERKNDLFKLHLVKSRDTENGKVLSYKVDLNVGSFIFIPEEGEEGTSSTSETSGYSEDEVF